MNNQLNEPLFEGGQNAGRNSLCSKITSLLLKKREFSESIENTWIFLMLFWTIVRICMFFTIYQQFTDSQTPGALFEYNKTLKTESSQLYTFIDHSCHIYKQDILIQILMVIVFLCPRYNVILGVC